MTLPGNRSDTPDDGPLLPAGLVEPLPLDEARIQQTMARARRSARRRFLRPVLAVLLLPLALVLGLLASGGFRWNDINVESLTFGNSIQVIEESDTYDFAAARCAEGKLAQDMGQVLVALHQWGTMKPQLSEAVHSAFASPEPPSTRYPGGFEELRDKIALGDPLTEVEATRLGQAFSAGIGAIRRLGRTYPEHQAITDLYAERLQAQADGLPIPQRRGTPGK